MFTTTFLTPLSGPTRSDSSECSALPHTAWSLVTWILAGAGAVPAYFTLPTMSPARAGPTVKAAMTGAKTAMVRIVVIGLGSFLKLRIWILTRPRSREQPEAAHGE